MCTQKWYSKTGGTCWKKSSTWSAWIVHLDPPAIFVICIEDTQISSWLPMPVWRLRCPILSVISTDRSPKRRHSPSCSTLTIAQLSGHDVSYSSRMVRSILISVRPWKEQTLNSARDLALTLSSCKRNWRKERSKRRGINCGCTCQRFEVEIALFNDKRINKYCDYSSKGYLGSASWWLRYFHRGLLLGCLLLSVTHIRLLKLLGILGVARLLLLHGWALLAASLLISELTRRITLIIGLGSRFLTLGYAVVLVLFADPVDLGLFLILVFCGLISHLLLVLLVILVGVVLVQGRFLFVTTVVLPDHLAHFVRWSRHLTVSPFGPHSVRTIAAISAIVVSASENIDAGLAAGGRQAFQVWIIWSFRTVLPFTIAGHLHLLLLVLGSSDLIGALVLLVTVPPWVLVSSLLWFLLGGLVIATICVDRLLGSYWRLCPSLHLGLLLSLIVTPAETPLTCTS